MSKYLEYDENEMTPYKKKKGKSGRAKSNHKHLYEECLVKSELGLHIGKYCSVCGKTQITNYFITVPTENSCARRMVFNNEEIKGLYPNLPIKEEKRWYRYLFEKNQRGICV